MKKRILSLLLAMLMVLSTVTILPITILAATSTKPDGAEWLIDEGDNHVWYKLEGSNLTIGGTGAMQDFKNGYGSPWVSYSSNITTIEIGANVTKIGKYAFISCQSVSDVTASAVTPPTLGGSILNLNENMKIHVPSGSVEQYKMSWSSYAGYIEASTTSATYAITNGTAQDANGSITVAETAASGATVTVTVTPDKGYQLKSLVVLSAVSLAPPIIPAQDAQDETKYNFTMPDHPVIVKAEFESAPTYAITNGTPENAKETNHGYITIDKTTAAKGETVTITVKPNEGYQLKSLTVTPVATFVEYVEIGGVKWATKNLGAEKVTDYGDYFAWGETAPYYEGTGGWPATPTWKSGKASGYAWQSYCGSSSFSEWSTPPYDATTKILKADFDVAAQILGDGWRMPTSAEFKALYDACLNGSYDTTTNPSGASASVGKGVYWCTNYDGVAGCLFCDGTNKLFFPAAGYGGSNGLINAGSYGYYWSSTLYPDDTSDGWRMFFYNTGVLPQHHIYRYWGHSVRPVKDAAPANQPLQSSASKLLKSPAPAAPATITPAKQQDGTYQFTMPGYPVTVTAEFEKHTHTFTYTADDGKITATCTQGCDKGYDTTPLTLTLTAPASLVYDGNAKAFTFADGEADAWMGAGLEPPTIFYNIKQSGQSTYLPLMSGTLKDVGNYMAQITVGEKTAQVYFSIVTSHTHNLVKVNGQAATEEVSGWKDYYKCDCGKFFEDAAGLIPIEDLDAWKVQSDNGYIAPLVHSITPVSGQTATQTEAGYKPYYECKNCGKYYEDASGLVEITDLAKWKAQGGNGYLAKLEEPTEPTKPTEPTEPTKPTKPTSPRTGDTNNMTLWLILMALSSVGLCACLVLGKKSVKF